MKLYLVDLIGEHSGAFYYNREFRKTLAKRFGNAEILSNYNDTDNNSRKLFLNYYRGGFFKKFYRFFVSLFRFWVFTLKERKSCIIFMTYGNAYEMLFLLPSFIMKNLIIDVHEVISPIERKQALRPLRKFYADLLYKNLAKAVIIHSSRTGEILNEQGFGGKRFEIPHFSYNMIDQLNLLNGTIEKLPREKGGVINILYFGFMRVSKGTEVITELVTQCGNDEALKRIRFTVAGNDPDNLMKELRDRSELNSGIKPDLRLRYITDLELRELFMFCDYVILPYTEVSQSGVMEMAIAFRKPVIVSPLQYFTEILTMFPSFGILSEGFKSIDYQNILKRIAGDRESGDNRYYIKNDVERFAVYKEPEGFLDELSLFLSTER